MKTEKEILFGEERVKKQFDEIKEFLIYVLKFNYSYLTQQLYNTLPQCWTQIEHMEKIASRYFECNLPICLVSFAQYPEYIQNKQENENVVVKEIFKSNYCKVAQITSESEIPIYSISVRGY